MKIVLKMNELGLYKINDGKYGIRQTAEFQFVVQSRENPDDPWDWKIEGYEPTFEKALTRVKFLIDADENGEDDE